MSAPLEVDPTEIKHVLGPGRWTSHLLARPAIEGLATVGIWRVTHADTGRTAILKLLRHATIGNPQWRSSEDPDHPYYWRREADALTSPLLTGLADQPLRPPRVHGAFERSDGSVAIWMEDAGTEHAGHWPVARYHKLAVELGRLQGRLVDSPDLQAEWLSHGYLRTYSERRDDMFGDIDDALWNRRKEHLAATEAQPQTLCHLDFHQLNIFALPSIDFSVRQNADARETTVLIDWAFSGVGGLGEDIGGILIDSVADFHLESRHLPELFDVLVAGFTEGLSASGISYSQKEIRDFVVQATLARYAWIPVFYDEARADGRPTINRRPAAEALPYFEGAAHFLRALS